MTEKKTRELLSLYDYFKSLNLEKRFTCKGLRYALLHEIIAEWNDGYRTHYVDVGTVLESPMNYKISILKQVKKKVEYFFDLQNTINMVNSLDKVGKSGGNESVSKK